MMSFSCTTTHLVQQQQTVLFEIVKLGENSLWWKPSLVMHFEPHPKPIKLLKLELHIAGNQLLADHILSTGGAALVQKG
jgi:hypothetical protein